MNKDSRTDHLHRTAKGNEGQGQVEQACHKLRKMFEEAIRMITLMVEMRDCHTAGHQQRVAQLAVAMAEELHFSDDQVWRMRMAGQLHDIGKIVVPIEILGKPGRLNEIELAIVRTHPSVGYEMLKQIDFAAPLADAVLQHHERMDGSGYPAGLVGEEILLEARILGVADVVEAMCSHRAYRPALGVEKALMEITTHKGTLFDSNVVDACLSLFRQRGFSFQSQTAMTRPESEGPRLAKRRSGAEACVAAG